MQTLVQTTNAEAAALLAEVRACSLQTESQLREQLADKDKQLLLLQGMLDAQAESRPSTPPLQTASAAAGDACTPSRKDRAFMDSMLLSVLEQRDTLQDQVGAQSLALSLLDASVLVF